MKRSRAVGAASAFVFGVALKPREVGTTRASIVTEVVSEGPPGTLLEPSWGVPERRCGRPERLEKTGFARS